MAYSNLGGTGPDTWAPASIRYVNVGKTAVPVPGVGFFTIYFDLEVTARSAYTPFNSSLNVLNGRFAQINLAANQHVDLRATVKRSCSTADSCNACMSLASYAARVHCFAAGCSCVGVRVDSMADCEAADKEAYRLAYNCSAAADTLVLPSTVRGRARPASWRGAVPAPRCPRVLYPYPTCCVAAHQPFTHWLLPLRIAGAGRHVRLRL